MGQEPRSPLHKRISWVGKAFCAAIFLFIVLGCRLDSHSSPPGRPAAALLAAPLWGAGRLAGEAGLAGGGGFDKSKPLPPNGLLLLLIIVSCGYGKLYVRFTCFVAFGKAASSPVC